MNLRIPVWNRGAASRPSKTSFVSLLHLLLAVAVAAPVFAASGAEADTAPRPGVRVVKLKGLFIDHPSGLEFDTLSLLAGDLSRPSSFSALCDKLGEFSRDDGIQEVLLDLTSPTLNMNLAQLAELSRRIGVFRKTGRKAVAWLENASTIHYSIASACDTIVMTEVGSLDLPSLSLVALHFKDAMDLIGAEASYTRTGEFKGAVEPYTRSEMSPELRAHYREMISSMNDALVDRIASARKMSKEQVRRLQGERIFSPTAAVKAGLVDRLAPAGSERETVRQLAGEDIRWMEAPSSKPKPMSFFELMGKIMGAATDRRPAGPSIVVLHLDGQIVDGEQELPGMIVSGPIVSAVEEIGADPNIRGVVVRVNSPGGSASASEAVRRALEQLAERKPIVFSMGDMAASGGYWITCVGRPIYAEPQTLTGSIGVFALKLSAGGLMNKVGIRFNSVALDESAGAMSLDRPWTPVEQGRMQEFVQEIYGRFLRLVSQSRGIGTNDVEKIAGGRVWSGQQAIGLKLVDQLGGLDRAMVAVLTEVGLPADTPVVHRPRLKNVMESLDLFGDREQEIQQLFAPAVWAAARRAGFSLAMPMTLVRQSLEGRGPQAWLFAPTEFVIR